MKTRRHQPLHLPSGPRMVSSAKAALQALVPPWTVTTD